MSFVTNSILLGPKQLISKHILETPTKKKHVTRACVTITDIIAIIVILVLKFIVAVWKLLRHKIIAIASILAKTKDGYISTFTTRYVIYVRAWLRKNLKWLELSGTRKYN